MELMKCDSCGEVVELQPDKTGWFRGSWLVQAREIYSQNTNRKSQKFDICPGCAPTIACLLSKVIPEEEEEKKDG